MKTVRAKKSLGQNFLKDDNVLKIIADSFETNEKDVIIEIGSGMGALTKYLVKKPSKLVCYELDERMKDYLSCYENERCQVIYDDFLKRDFKEDISDYEHLYVIANLPYYITTPILEHILNSEVSVSGMTILIQKEVALRFTAKPKSKDYGYFTVYLRHFFNSTILCDVAPSAFVPAPKVTSSVVKMTKKEHVEYLNIKEFQKFLMDAFKQKRKTLKNNLKQYNWVNIYSVLESLGYSENVRAEEISYEDYVLLFRHIKN